MRKPRGRAALVAISIVAALVIAAALGASGAVAERATDAVGVAGIAVVTLVATAGVWLTAVDLLRSRSARDAAMTAVRAAFATLCTLGMWHAVTAGNPLLFVVGLFGALVALALMLLFALAKAPDASIAAERASA